MRGQLQGGLINELPLLPVTPLLIPRPEWSKIDGNPAIHYGLIASANHLLWDALLRDRLVAKRDVLCFDIGTASVANHFSCLVVLSVCDYSDSHKNKE